MSTVLITGSSGFVGKYMIEYMEHLDLSIIKTTRLENETSKNNVYMDLLDQASVSAAIKRVQPSHIVHLGGQSSVSSSWKDKRETLNTNIYGTLNILDAVREYSPNCRILSVGSSEEYGLIEVDDCPINESNATRPLSPYGLSKLSAGILSMQYARAYDVDVIHTRTFNHIGPGQSSGFVTQDFAKQIVAIEKGKGEPLITVGNLESIRDFTDVRDIVAAYTTLLFKANRAEIYNVCSGTGISIYDILRQLLELSNVSIDIATDTSKLRPSDIPIMIGDNSKLIQTTDWNKKIPLNISLSDILEEHRKEI